MLGLILLLSDGKFAAGYFWFKREPIMGSRFKAKLRQKKFIAAAVSEPEANERGSSLIDHFLPNARNCGYVRMKHLRCAMHSQGSLVMREKKLLGCAMDSQGTLVL